MWYFKLWVEWGYLVSEWKREEMGGLSLGYINMWGYEEGEMLVLDSKERIKKWKLVFFGVLVFKIIFLCFV